jgi:Flp pilus assembly protein TadB
LTALFVATAGTVVAAAFAVRNWLAGGRGRAVADLTSLDRDALATRRRRALGLRPRDGVGLARLPFPFGYLNRRMREAGVQVSLQVVVTVAAGGALACWAAATLLLGAGWPADLALAGGLWAPLVWIERQAARRREAVALEMERVAAALEGAVSAGMVPYEALVEVGSAGGGTLGPELLRTVADADRVGLSEALVLLAARLPLPEVALLVASLRLNQGAGAALSGSLAGLHATLRERRETAAAMRAATAAGRWQAGMLVAVPPILLLFMRLVYPAFEAPLFDTGAGRALLAASAAWLLLGHAIVRRMCVPPDLV